MLSAKRDVSAANVGSAVDVAAAVAGRRQRRMPLRRLLEAMLK
jgi:hypothetical protein